MVLLWLYCVSITAVILCKNNRCIFLLWYCVVNHLIPWPPLPSLSFILLYIIVNGNTCTDRPTDQPTVSIPVTWYWYVTRAHATTLVCSCEQWEAKFTTIHVGDVIIDNWNYIMIIILELHHCLCRLGIGHRVACYILCKTCNEATYVQTIILGYAMQYG